MIMLRIARRSLLALLAGALGLPANAQLADCWEPANWTINANNTTTANTVGTFLITMDNDTDFLGSGLDSIDCAETEGTSTVCITVPATGDFTFDWSIAGAPFFYNPFIDRFGYCLNGVVTELSSADPPPFGTSAGTTTVSLTAGDAFCFIYASKFSDVGFPLTVSISNFLTPGCAAACDASSEVTGLSVDGLHPSGTGAMLSWSPLAGADGYQIEGGVSGSGSTARKQLAGSMVSIPGLTPGTSYTWRVRARCAGTGVITAWSAESVFSTPTLRAADAPAEMTLSPNPARDRVLVRQDAGPSTVLLRNALGAVVASASGDGDLRVGLDGLAPGLYLVERLGADGRSVAPLVVE
jgi:hypothetical protein